MRCNESLIGMSALTMHNQQVSTSATNNNMIPTLDVKSNTKFQAPNILPKENTIEVCDVERHKMIFMLPFFKCAFLLVTYLLTNFIIV